MIAFDSLVQLLLANIPLWLLLGWVLLVYKRYIESRLPKPVEPANCNQASE